MERLKNISARQVAYAVPSFLMGAWAFKKVNEISGPTFEPIIAACTNPDYSSVDEFVSATGYHAYEPMVGLGAFKVLVCLITQFILELRNTYPAGILVWGGIIIVLLPCCMLSTLEAGRANAIGLVRYPVLFGLLGQLFGISVVFPLLYVPFYIFGRGRGPVTVIRAMSTVPNTIPPVILTNLVFTAPTDSYLWTVSAGMLGGPILAMFPIVLWTDKSPSLPPTKENIETSINTVKSLTRSIMIPISFAGWMMMVAIAYQTYGLSLSNLWNDIWVEANSSVAFMTIDTLIFYLGMVLCVAYQSEAEAIKMVLLTPFLGPGAAGYLALLELEETRCGDLKEVQKKKT